jgi:hypothetical protein
MGLLGFDDGLSPKPKGMHCRRRQPKRLDPAQVADKVEARLTGSNSRKTIQITAASSHQRR